MHVHVNHCFCTDSIWGGMYDSSYMVCIRERLGYTTKEQEKDWDLLIHADFFSKERYEELKNWHGSRFSETDLVIMSTKKTPRLKYEILAWLETNIKDQNGEKGYGFGTDEYNARAFMEFNLWFKRRSDAMKFIKTWSFHKKPTTYFDYFKMIRKELNFKTKTLQHVEEFTKF